MGASIAATPDATCCISSKSYDVSCPSRDPGMKQTQQGGETGRSSQAGMWTTVQVCHSESIASDYINSWTHETRVVDGDNSFTIIGVERAPAGFLPKVGELGDCTHRSDAHVYTKSVEAPFDPNISSVSPSHASRGEFKSMQASTDAAMIAAANSFSVISCCEGVYDDEEIDSKKLEEYTRCRGVRKKQRVAPGRECFAGETEEEYHEWEDRRLALFDKDFNDGL